MGAENHPFSSPSYGIVGHDRIDYPFNLGCGTAHQVNSYVEAWIYDSQGLRSNPVDVALTCTT
jgi:eukaryotic-like serine/threonine-protein kinase